MIALIFETTDIKETKNHYTLAADIPQEHFGVKRPIIKKVLYGITIQKPIAYRIYNTKHENGGETTCRTWVFPADELNITCKRDAIWVKKINKE